MLFTKKLKNRPYIFLIGLFISTSTWAQIPQPPKTVQSPNASTLGIYGDFPVSPFTGAPDISVNLHTLADANFQIPISLSYDATGVRPDVHPGWTGMNFGISTNYAVVRTVRDALDDYPDATNYLWERGFINGNVRNSLDYNATDWTSTTKLETISYNSGLIDLEPDEYSFTAPGLSGKFYLSPDGQWKVQSDRAIKVELINFNTAYPPFTPPGWTGSPWATGGASSTFMPHFTGFIVTDEDGTKYQFGGDNSFNEYSMEFFNQGKGTWLCNSWYLKSITKHTGQVVNLTYERGDFIAQMYFSVYNKSSRINGGSLFACSGWSSLIGTYGAYNGKLISPIYLKEISGDNFKAKFTSSVSTELPYTEDVFSTYFNQLIAAGQYSTDFLAFLYGCPTGCSSPLTLSALLAKLKWRQLDKIEIQNGSGATIKQFALTYNDVATERLMLKKVQEISGYDNAKKIPPYEFTYYTDLSGTPLTMPGYSKSHTDHWGFNNGIFINASNFDAMGSYGNTYRSAATDERYYLLSTLAQIKYPTGGITKFWFQPHSYAKEVKLKRWEGVDTFTSNQRAGGLRIKEIHSSDPNSTNPVVKRKFYYLSSFNPASPDTSASVLSSGVLGGKAQYYWPDYKPKASDAGITVEQEIFSTQSLLPGTENSMGSHIGYSNVVEWASTEGWTVHKFSNFDNGYLDSAPSGFIQASSTPYQPYNSNAFQRGKLLEKAIYFQNGNPASKTSYQYSVIGTLATNSVRGVKASLALLCNTDHRVYEATAYIISTQKFLPDQEINYIYDQDNAASFTPILKGYKYDASTGQVTSRTFYDSKDTPFETFYKYPNSNTSDLIILGMASRNIIGNPIEIAQTTQLGNPYNIKTQTVTYDLFDGHYLPKKVETKIGTAATATTDIEFLTYDARGNLLTYKERNGLETKLEYYGTSDIGKIDLLKKHTVWDGAAISQSKSYDYQSLVGISGLTDANNKVINYDYDDFNRLKTVKNPSGAARASYCYNYAGQLTPCSAMAPTGSIAATTLSLITPAALPVTLLEFKASKIEETEASAAALLTWSTTAETNSEHFDIERSKDGKQWIKIGSVKASGESSELQRYAFTDKLPIHGENLYRLKMVDVDKTFAYSRIESVNFDKNDKVVLFPNPITIGQALNLQVDDIEKVGSIKIFDSAGKLVIQSGAVTQINTSKLTSGLYMVQITFKDGSISTHRIMKQ